jgi:hypothetical protein
MSTVNNGPQIVRSGLILDLDASLVSSYSAIAVYSVQCYSTYNGGLRSANYTVQYSDDNTTWTTAFTGVMSNNSSCGIITGTNRNDSNYSKHRYWRYVEGGAVVGHHPRVSRIDFITKSGAIYNLTTYTTDNCADSGTYIVGTVTKDFGTTTWRDTSGNGYNGTLTSGPTFDVSNKGNILFDGSDDNIQLGNASTFLPTSGITINSWAKTNVTGVYKKLFVTVTSGLSTITGIYFSLGPSPDNIYLGVITNNGNQYATSTTNPSTSLFSNFCGTYDGANIKLYLNGALIATKAQTGTIVNTGIGRISGYDSNTEVWNGNIATFSIYNRALSAAEISQNYEATRTKFGL